MRFERQQWESKPTLDLPWCAPAFGQKQPSEAGLADRQAGPIPIGKEFKKTDIARVVSFLANSP